MCVQHLENRILLSAGTLDIGFGNQDGQALEGTPGSQAVFTSIDVDGEGRIVAAGREGSLEAAWRYNADGTPDTTFGDHGFVPGLLGEFDDSFTLTSVLVQNKQLILLGGDELSFDGGEQGTLRQLSSEGKTQLHERDFKKPVIDIVELKDESIVVALPGELRRFDAKLKPIQDFGNAGVLSFNSGDRPRIANDPGHDRIVVLADNKLLAFNSSGQPDTSFGDNGSVTLVKFIATNLSIDSSGRVVLSGKTKRPGDPSDRDFAVMRLTSSGEVDPEFNNGKPFARKFIYDAGKTSLATDIAVRGDGAIIAIGTTVDTTAQALLAIHADNTAAVQLRDDGSLDPTFDDGGSELLNLDKNPSDREVPLSLALGSDQSIFAAGTSGGMGSIADLEPNPVIVDTDNAIVFVRGSDNNDSIDIADSDNQHKLEATVNGVLTSVNLDELPFAQLEVRGIGGNDHLTVATNLSTMIDGGKGNDLIQSSASAQTIFGAGGKDTIQTGAGNDRIYGEAGNDLIEAGNGNDVLYGGQGNDTLAGGAGRDSIHGDSGSDILSGNTGNDRLFNLDAFADTVNGGAGTDANEIDSIDLIQQCETPI